MEYTYYMQNINSVCIFKMSAERGFVFACVTNYPKITIYVSNTDKFCYTKVTNVYQFAVINSRKFGKVHNCNFMKFCV